MQNNMSEVFQLRELSARLGNDEMVVQAGGGNTSLKTASGLWIKASGTRLSDAMEGDIFLLLPWDQLEHWMAGDQEVLTGLTPRGRSVRASVETAMHVAMPHRFVAHTHSVRGISWLVCPDRERELQSRLSGFRWAKLPYVHPGRNLAAAIRKALKAREVDLLLIENHGLVIGNDDSEQLMKYMAEVESRLEVLIRSSRSGMPGSVHKEIRGWTQVGGEVDSLAFDEDGLRIAGGGTLYPDHCVYLGPSVAIVQSVDGFEDTLTEYECRYGMTPKVAFVKHQGAFLREPSSEEAHIMLRCLVNVVNRINPGSSIRYLPAIEVSSLVAWEAEAYRRKVAAEMR
jgi:rhamnose utilization protein RhaD (predicted bifunctional aldolase and dehydrogenase)